MHSRRTGSSVATASWVDNDIPPPFSFSLSLSFPLPLVFSLPFFLPLSFSPLSFLFLFLPFFFLFLFRLPIDVYRHINPRRDDRALYSYVRIEAQTTSIPVAVMLMTRLIFAGYALVLAGRAIATPNISAVARNVHAFDPQNLPFYLGGGVEDQQVPYAPAIELPVAGTILLSAPEVNSDFDHSICNQL